jgi:hypothetical protein
VSRPPRTSPRDGPESLPGLGRFRAGKWEFPAPLDGVPVGGGGAPPGPAGGPAVEHLARAGGKIYVATEDGVYEGPGKWRQVLAGPVYRMQALAGGKQLGALRADPARKDGEPARFQRGTYDPAAGKWTFAPLPAADAWAVRNSENLLDPGAVPEEIDRWVVVPAGNGKVAFGPLPDTVRQIVQTPAAVWVVQHGRLIRLDRRALDALGDKSQR